MWWILVVSLASIPIFHFFDNKQLVEDDLFTVENLILSKDSWYDPGGGKSSSPSIKFNFTSTTRRFQLIQEEIQCVKISGILTNFKKGDTVTIKIDKSDKEKFNGSNWFSQYSKLYGLAKKGQSYLSLECGNKVSVKRTNAGKAASICSAILSLGFALFILRPKTKYQAYGQFPIDPIFVVILVWLIVCIALR